LPAGTAYPGGEYFLRPGAKRVAPEERTPPPHTRDLYRGKIPVGGGEISFAKGGK